jgi:predicted amidohydrolase YtcJ
MANDPYIVEISGPRLGKERQQDIFPAMKVINAGGVFSFGTDWPVSSYTSEYRPLMMIRTAVLRQLPGLDDRRPPWRRGGTDCASDRAGSRHDNAAYGMGYDDIVGSLEAGKTVMPGFISTHDHLIASDWTTYGVQLFDLEAKEEVLARIKEYAEANPDEKVIKGIGWSAGKFGGRPLATELDKAVSDRPAIILDFTVHDAWLNSRAMEIGKITKDTPDTLPKVTYWERDKDGTPTGTAIEGQWMGAYIAVGAWEPEKMIRESTDKLMGIAASNGTTTFLNPGIVTPNMKDTHGGMEKDFEAALAMLQDMAQKGKLKLRTFPAPIFKKKKGDPQRFVDFGVKMREKYNSDMLRVQQLKIHPEGNWNAEVAPFLKPYETGKQGVFNVDPETTAAIVLAAGKADMDVISHSDSDGTARAMVDAILAARKAGYANRSAIHHATWIHPDDVKRIIENKIPINTTPKFSNDFSGTDKDAYRALGRERTETEFGRYPDLARAGVSVSLSADVPGTPPDMQVPLFVIQGAVTLKNPADPNAKHFPPGIEPMSLEQAIRGMTAEAAWQLRMEDKIGSLEVGKYADLVVLEKNPFDVDPMEISGIDVLMTMMDGRFTYRADGDEREEGDRVYPGDFERY